MTLIGAAIALLVLGFILYILVFILPGLPALDAITDYRPKIPLRVYTADHALIGEFGEEHRDFTPVAQIPDMMKKAVVAIEDTRFYSHHGVDYIGMVASLKSLAHGHLRGFSTITMQLPRNFVISRERSLPRKLSEMILAYRIEGKLSKDQILELYMNQIYLGQRSYGFGSAARTYFGKPLSQLSIAEVAMLAGLPKNPSQHNPISNPKRARERQHVVLARMHELSFISDAQYQQALREPLHISTKGQGFETHAEFVAELARQAVVAQFKDDAYTRGYTVTTTILKADQDAAYESVRRNVLAYDQRHGYRGPEEVIDLPQDEHEREDAIDEALQDRPNSDRLMAAVVISASSKLVRVDAGTGETLDISGEGLKFAAPALAANAKASIKLRPGAVIRISQEGKRWSITQVPQVAAAFVSLDAHSGAYRAMVGGFDYNLQKFNHVTQAWRQPGSSLKPFLYSSSLEKGYSPATLVNDAPLDLAGEDAGATWSPQNDDMKYDGPITLRRALAHSKNVVSVRLLRRLGVPYVHQYLGKFGFDVARHQPNLTMALGTGAVTPLQMAGAYSIFANGGFQVQPYLIAKITDARGNVISEAKPAAAFDEANRVLDPRNAFVVDTMLRDVVRYGTGAAATQKLGRMDLAGKTGTTSDAVDGWFAGYGANVVAVAWMGYDDPKSLGGREFGATLALPIWTDFMRVALARQPQAERRVPEGVSQVDGDWVYDEFKDGGAVRSIDLDDAPVTPPSDTAAPPAPAPAPP
ncbi:MAG: PBP1A family penicillin-binding protein [Pseudomonadota bacterium]